jgi:hypothetical protein
MKTSKGFFILSDDDGVIQIENSESTWVRSFEDKYNAKHRQNYEGSMSACINYISFRPSVVRVESAEDIGERLLNIPFKIQSVRNVSGGFTGVTSDKDMSEEWEKGVKPRMINR